MHVVFNTFFNVAAALDRPLPYPFVPHGVRKVKMILPYGYALLIVVKKFSFCWPQKHCFFFNCVYACVCVCE